MKSFAEKDLVESPIENLNVRELKETSMAAYTFFNFRVKLSESDSENEVEYVFPDEEHEAALIINLDDLQIEAIEMDEKSLIRTEN